MRLIDADTLADALFEKRKNYPQWVADTICNMPTIDALSLLKQEAVKARKKDDGKPQPWTSWWYVCGDCGQEIEYHDRFCRWCGRSVNWDAS